MVDRVGDWRRGVLNAEARLRALADQSERAGLADRAEAFRVAAMHVKLCAADVPADLRAYDDERWKPENFAPLVDGVAYRF